MITRGAVSPSLVLGGKASSAMFSVRPSSSAASPMTSTLIASLKLEWWPVQLPMTPPMLSRWSSSPPLIVSGTSPTKPFRARRRPSTPIKMSPGFIFASRPVGNSSMLYVALSVIARTTTTSPDRGDEELAITATVLTRPSGEVAEPILSASITLIVVVIIVFSRRWPPGNLSLWLLALISMHLA
jgi:hypothetical protein